MASVAKGSSTSRDSEDVYAAYERIVGRVFDPGEGEVRRIGTDGRIYTMPNGYRVYIDFSTWEIAKP